MNTGNDRFSIIGCGRVGVTLSAFLSGKTFQAAAFFSRSPASARFARAMTGQGCCVDTGIQAVRASDIVFIATPDSAIEPVCQALAGENAFDDHHTVYHLSGALSSDILAGARNAGADTGSLHPLQAFTPFEKGQFNPFSRINMSVEGTPQAVKTGTRIISELGARPFTIPTDAKTLYHAAAVAASNYLVTLQNMALELLMETGLEEAKAFDILAPLIRGTLDNIRARGCAGALTGPVARGDLDIIRRHLGEIDQKFPENAELYRTLGRYTLALASRNNTYAKEAKKALSKLFAHPDFMPPE